MPDHKSPPSGYFDATDLLKQVEHPSTVKVSQFFDSQEVSDIMGSLDEPKLSQNGRGGYTWIRNELLSAYTHWLKSVGSGRGRKKLNTL